MQPLEAFFRGSTSAGALLSENQLLRQEGGSTHFFTGRPDRTLRPNETLKKKARERERVGVTHNVQKKKKEHLSSLFPVLICWFLPLHCFHIGSTLAVFIQTRSVAHANGLLLLFPQVAWFHSRGFYPWKESAFRNIFDILFSLHRKKKEASSLVQKPLWHSFCSWMNRNGKKKKTV